MTKEEMELWDHFAGLAMQSIINNPDHQEGSWSDIAEHAYVMADCMILQRQELLSLDD